jgi:hypothetical protein
MQAGYENETDRRWWGTIWTTVSIFCNNRYRNDWKCMCEGVWYQLILKETVFERKQGRNGKIPVAPIF